MRLLGATSVVRLRASPQTIGADGRPSISRTSTTIVASVQPPGDDELENLGLGRRVQAAIKVYSYSEIIAGNTTGGVEPDRLTWDGRTWQVESAATWPPIGCYPRHYRAIAVLLGEIAP
jgi:hypothetical protein